MAQVLKKYKKADTPVADMVTAKTTPTPDPPVEKVKPNTKEEVVN